MRRHRREQPAAAFHGSELRWLLAGVLMLVVLFMLMSRLREPSALSWLSEIDQSAPKPQSPPPATPLPAATGPTDEEPEEAETARTDFQAITDGTLNLGPEEMVPYNQLVSWVKNQSFARLWARAKKNLAYTYLYDEAKEHRGMLVGLDVTIQLVNDAGKNDAGVPLHEVWATTQQSGNRLYVFIVVDLPSTLPLGRRIQEKAQFTGYFLKLQGYDPKLSKPGQPPERAPLLIGRIEWTPTAAPAAETSQEWIWGSAALGLIAAVLIVRFVLGKLGRRKTTPGGILSPTPDSVIPVDRWLEESGFTPPTGNETNDADREGPTSTNGP